MLGAIAGDVIGSVFEGSGLKRVEFPLLSPRSTYTDDTVVTVAIASAILEGGDFAQEMRTLCARHPGRGYGGFFHEWLLDEALGPYNSWGNGSAMRVSPVGWAFGSVEEVLTVARETAQVTHNHPEGIQGAQATALCVFLARQGAEKSEIRREIERRFGYELNRRVEEMRPTYTFDVSCQGSVPESIICFLDSEDFESAVRLAVSLGGDADTMACIAGGIAEAWYGGLQQELAVEIRKRLSPDLLAIVDQFRDRYCTA